MDIQWELLFFSLFVALGMGGFAFVAITEVNGKLQSIRLPGAVSSLFFLGLGGMFSFFHLGHPERIFHMLGNMESGISQEFLSSGFAGSMVALYTVLLLKKDSSPKWRKGIAIIGFIAAIVVVLSTGKIYLQGARPAWNTIIIPLMYLASAGPLGLFLMYTWASLKSDDLPLLKMINKITFYSQIAFMATIIMYLLYLGFAPFPDPSRSSLRLLTGDLAPAFWLLVVGIGLMLPMGITAKVTFSDNKHISALLPFFGLICTIVGAGTIRALMYLLGSSVHQYITG